ncbi:hypothetical protein [Sphingobium fluviale]|uniref:Uncharacterized protein n=1 Tax=Sphingobium fluviale TaxID=2506423 RepID=A0A4Q1KJI1_9SPHN|nr:hypothetical protein [Sphingobium fluviale]RXR29973.1 hypothetical protein EQG66_05430 [Sphingobium fluviale]
MVLAASLGACGQASVGGNDSSTELPNTALAVNSATKNVILSFAPRSFGELKREDFVPSERRVIGMTSPTNLPNGAIAEGTPIMGVLMSKGAEQYECREPSAQWPHGNVSEADMTNWMCSKIRG